MILYCKIINIWCRFFSSDVSKSPTKKYSDLLLLNLSWMLKLNFGLYFTINRLIINNSKKITTWKSNKHVSSSVDFTDCGTWFSLLLLANYNQNHAYFLQNKLYFNNKQQEISKIRIYLLSLNKTTDNKKSRQFLERNKDKFYKGPTSFDKTPL